MTRADELWADCQYNGWIGPTSFKAALREYGAAIRKRDAEICRGIAFDQHMSQLTRHGALLCIDFLEQEPLP